MQSAQLVGASPREARLVRRLMGELGYALDVIIANRDPVQTARRNQPSLLIVELDRSRPEAVAVIRKLRAATQGWIIAVLPWIEPTIAKRVLKAGASDYLTAPIDPALLRHRVSMIPQHQAVLEGVVAGAGA